MEVNVNRKEKSWTDSQGTPVSGSHVDEEKSQADGKAVAVS